MRCDGTTGGEEEEEEESDSIKWDSECGGERTQNHRCGRRI